MIAGNAESKVAFANATRGLAASLLQVLDRLADLQETYVARDYQPGGADALKDDDVRSALVTVDELSKLLAPDSGGGRLMGLMKEIAPILRRLRSDM